MTARRSRTTSPDGVSVGPVRLQKLLAAAGLGSRRSCERWIEDGRVSVDGKTAKLGDRADPVVQRVDVDGERLVLDKPVYWMLNKPKGVLTTLSDPEGRSTVARLLPTGIGRIFPVGRLDVDTEGLLLLTNDGALAHALLHPSLGSEREYEVVVKGEFDEKRHRSLERGVRLEDGTTAPARVHHVSYDDGAETTRFRLILKEGRKRQIRRSLMTLGRPVKQLQRIRMGPIKLGKLARGKSRELSADEIQALRKHCKLLDAARDRRAKDSRSRARGGPKAGRARR